VISCCKQCANELTLDALFDTTATTRSGIFGSLFSKGEQAVDDAKHTAQDTLSAAERKANQAKRAGKDAVDDASKKANEAADEGKGESPFLCLFQQ
jgi:ElaB/YqjD/DUF883 family membrane-anchored ribosome-binding protein